MVSKTAVLLTEMVFESDLVSKTPYLLTEWVFEGDLVSKMPHLLTEKGVRRARCAFMPHTLHAPNGPEGIERQIGRARWSTQKHTLHKRGGLGGATMTRAQSYFGFESATITPSRLARRGRECPRRGLGGFVGFSAVTGAVRRD
jgi:hypothetical protein